MTYGDSGTHPHNTKITKRRSIVWGWRHSWFRNSCLLLYSPPACVASDIRYYSHGLSFASLDAGRIESYRSVTNCTSIHANGIAKRLEGIIAQYNEREGRLLEGDERLQSVGLLSSASVGNFINWPKFFYTSALIQRQKKLIA